MRKPGNQEKGLGFLAFVYLTPDVFLGFRHPGSMHFVYSDVAKHVVGGLLFDRLA
jgi:hypothetical protein